MKSYQSGFGVIQAIVVVAILGVVGMVAMPKYQAFVTKSQLTEALNIANESKRKLEMYYMTNGRFPKNMREAEALKTETLAVPEYVADMAVIPEDSNNDVIVKVFLKDGVVENLDGNLQYLYIAGNKRSTSSHVEWTCGAIGISPDLLPDSCKAQG
jgi:type IV pilus assembly protein PilA